VSTVSDEKPPHHTQSPPRIQPRKTPSGKRRIRGSDDEWNGSGGNDSGQVSERPCLPTGAAESAIGRLVLPRPRRDVVPSPKIGSSESDTAGKSRKHLFTGSYNVKRNIAAGRSIARKIPCNPI